MEEIVAQKRINDEARADLEKPFSQRSKRGQFATIFAWVAMGIVISLIAKCVFFGEPTKPENFTMAQAAEHHYGYRGNVTLYPVYHAKINERKSFFGPEYKGEHAYCGELDAFDGGDEMFATRQHVATFRFISHPDSPLRSNPNEFNKGDTDYHADWARNGLTSKSGSYESKSFEDKWKHYCDPTAIAEGPSAGTTQESSPAQKPEVSSAPVTIAKSSTEQPSPGVHAVEAKPAVSGAVVYEHSCAACHATGVAGAPRLGWTADWERRLAGGIEPLYRTALSGKGAMPPKGTYAGPDSEVLAAVDYMVNAAK
ncbi:c-type cytochrome [Ralstonia solanacearum]|uniref:C-type cytochrome n=1 Tax=Ralstonia solanacearum TaxID=305 RepID=A0AAW5ZVB4_RALSL|nr:c-type cytochrome [Ralstonia solanacearum]MDB0573866.1 c-type cytochrome [Ralstonia solanacearum]